MSGEPSDDRSLEERILELNDPDGSFREMVAGITAFAGSAFGRTVLRVVGEDPTDLLSRITEFHKTTEVVAEGIRQFTSLGWAPSNQTPLSGVKEALARLAAGGSVTDAEDALADAWDRLLEGASLVNRVGTLGLPCRPYNAFFVQRRLLLFKAWKHHRAGAYEASIPIVFAQVEGICFDVTNRPFFSMKEGRRVEPVDDATLAGMDEALPVARAWFSAGVDDTTMSPAPGSRHGVLHGRALAYDNRLLSIKAIALLLAVIEWARPIAAELAKWFEAEEFARHPGSRAIDADGRVLDQREFRETRKALHWLSTCHSGWYQNRVGVFPPELFAKIEGDLNGKHGLPVNHGVHVWVAKDGQSWFAWRRTPSGFVLGIGANVALPNGTLRHGGPIEWRWEDWDAPDGPPGVDPGWGDDPFAMSSNW